MYNILSFVTGAAANSTFTDEEAVAKPLILSVHKMVTSITQLQECVDAVLNPYT